MLSGSGPLAQIATMIDPEFGQALGVLSGPAMMAASAGMAGGMGAAGGMEGAGMGAVGAPDLGAISGAAMPMTPPVSAPVMPPMDMASMAPPVDMPPPAPSMPVTEPGFGTNLMSSVSDLAFPSAEAGQSPSFPTLSGEAPAPKIPSNMMNPMGPQVSSRPSLSSSPPQSSSQPGGTFKFSNIPDSQTLGKNVQSSIAESPLNNGTTTPPPQKEPWEKMIDNYGKYQEKMLKYKMGMGAAGSAMKGIGAAFSEGEKRRNYDYKKSKNRKNQIKAMNAQGRRRSLAQLQQGRQERAMAGDQYERSSVGSGTPFGTTRYGSMDRRKI